MVNVWLMLVRVQHPIPTACHLGNFIAVLDSSLRDLICFEFIDVASLNRPKRFKWPTLAGRVLGSDVLVGGNSRRHLHIADVMLRISEKTKEFASKTKSSRQAQVASLCACRFQD